MASMKSLAKDTAIYGLSSIVGRFLNYLLVPLYTHVITAQSGGYGIVTNLYAYVALILVILTFGMETTFFRFVNKDDENPHTVFSTSVVLVSTLSVLFFAFVFIFIEGIADFLGYVGSENYILMMACVVCLDAFQAIPFSYLRYKKKAITAIADCKTGAIGAHKYVCDECGYEEIAYNSCRNRHCPNCQAGKKLQWIEARKEEVLNIKYYHVVFTIPDELNLITLQNQSKIYKILFKASAETLQELAEDKKYLGGELGFFSILHTWGQNMMYHPHVHIVTTGGGLTELNKWVEKEEDFFIPVKVMSKVFRGKFLYYLKQEKIDFYGKNKYLENPASYNSLIQELYNKD